MIPLENPTWLIPSMNKYNTYCIVPCYLVGGCSDFDHQMIRKWEIGGRANGRANTAVRIPDGWCVETLWSSNMAKKKSRKKWRFSYHRTKWVWCSNLWWSIWCIYPIYWWWLIILNTDGKLWKLCIIVSFGSSLGVPKFKRSYHYPKIWLKKDTCNVTCKGYLQCMNFLNLCSDSPSPKPHFCVTLQCSWENPTWCNFSTNPFSLVVKHGNGELDLQKSSRITPPIYKEFPNAMFDYQTEGILFGPAFYLLCWSSVDYRPICFLVNDNRSLRNSQEGRGIAKSQFPARLGRVFFVVLFESMVDPGAILNRCGVPRSSHGVPVDGKVTANPMRVTGVSTGVKPMLIEA